MTIAIAGASAAPIRAPLTIRTLAVAWRTAAVAGEVGACAVAIAEARASKSIFVF